jgi:hypothetical protein
MSTKITAASANLLRSSVYSVLGTTSTGYGAGLISRDVIVGQTITTSSYYALVDDLRRCWIHQTGGLVGFPGVADLPQQGDPVSSTLSALIDTVTSNAYITPPVSQLSQDSLASSTSTVFNNNSLTYSVDYTFADNDNANYFFNLGGRISAGLSHAGGTYVDNTATWAGFIDWANSKIGSFGYARSQWVSPTAVSTSYTSSTNCVVRLGIFAKDNHTIRSTVTVTNVISRVDIPTTATSYITYSTTGTAVEGYYGVASPRPQASIVTSFGSGQTLPVVPTKTLTVSQPTDFTFPSDSNSYAQTITITNAGNSTCTVSSITYPAISNVTTDISYPGGIAPPWSINPSETHTFDLRYFGLTGLTAGTYNSSFSVYSDAIVSPVTVNTRLVVTTPVFDFYLIPDKWDYTYTYGDSRSVTQSVTIGGKGSFTSISYGTDTNFLSSGFSIRDSSSVVGFDITFNPAGLINKTYITTATIGINSVTHPFTATIALNVPAAPVTQHLGDWVSALQKDNGVIGASYDIIGGIKYITLGFGMGADGGGNVSDTVGSDVNVTNLGIGANADSNFALGPVLYPGPGSAQYSNFLNPYNAVTNPDGHGVWVNDSGWSPVGVFVARTYTFTVANPGTHTYLFAADNQAYFTVGGVMVGDLRYPANGLFTPDPVQDTFTLTTGIKTLTVYFYNGNNGYVDNVNNPGSIALVITGPSGLTVWDSKLPVRTAYKYWNEVCRIPLYTSTSTPATYYSKDYIIKNLCPLNGYSYGSCFGDTGSIQEGSMFTVTQGTLDDITISLNVKSARDIADKTTNYSSYLFYYYSDVLGSDRLTQLEFNPGAGNSTHYFTGFDRTGAVTTALLPQPAAPYVPPAPESSGGGGDGGGSVSVNAYLPYNNKSAGAMVMGDPLLLLTPDGKGTVDGSVISNRISQQKLLTLVSSSGIRLTCSDNTPLTLQDGSCINSTQALSNLLPVQDSNGFRWEEIVEVIDAGVGNVATIFCNNQCYAAGDEPDRWIWTHNLINIKI